MGEESKIVIFDVTAGAVRYFRRAIADVAEVYADSTISTHEKDERAAIVHDRLTDEMKKLCGELDDLRHLGAVKLADDLDRALFDMGADFIRRQKSRADREKNENTLKTMQHYFSEIRKNL